MRESTDDLHATAVTIPCRECGAAIGELCVNKTTEERLATRIPHPRRLRDAEEVPF